MRWEVIKVYIRCQIIHFVVQKPNNLDKIKQLDRQITQWDKYQKTTDNTDDHNKPTVTKGQL